MFQQSKRKLATQTISSSKNKKSILTSKWLGMAGLLLMGMLFVFLLLPVQPALALPAGFQEYFVLGNEEQIWRMFDYIQQQEDSGGTTTDTRMCSVVTMVATTDNQIIYYDHWEDGYEADILYPTQGSTEVYGDGNLGNGGTGSDILLAGDIISLNSNQNDTTIHGTIPVNPRNPSEIRYDSGDHILSSGGPVDVAHPVWPYDQSYNGDAWEVYSAQVYQGAYSYRVPIGVDLYTSDPRGTPPGNAGYFGDFKYVWLQLETFEDNTNISIDNGASVINITLNKGQTYSSMGYIGTAAAPAITINAGTKIVADQPIQVGLITGADSTYQARFAVMLPYMMWGTDYVAPVPSSASSPAQVYIFNPNDHAISVTAYDTGGNGTFSIPANVTGSTVAYSQPGVMNCTVPVNSAVRFTSKDPFSIFISIDSSNITYDWSLSGIPARYLTDDYYVSWAPGNSCTPPNNPTCDENPNEWGIQPAVNGSPVWVTPLANNTTFYVDYGPVDGVVDETFTLNTLAQRTIFDNVDKDNTGMHIWATGKFATAWGEDPATAGTSTPYLDLGYAVLPLYQGWLNPVLSLDKSATPEILPVGGGAATFQLQVNTYSPAPVTNLNITDTLPSGWTYVPGTTLITYPDGSTATPNPAQNGRILTWNLAQTMDSNETLKVQFQGQFQSGATRSDGFEAGYSGGSGNWASNWIESEGNDPANGDIQIVGNADVTPPGGTKQLQIADDDQTIYRQVDLTNFTKPTLRFKRYFRALEGGETFGVDVSVGGGSFTSVLSWTNPTQNAWGQEEIDLSSYITNTVRIRFRGISSVGSGDYLHIDDVEIYDTTIHENQGLAVGTFNGRLFNASDKATVYISALNLEKTVNKSTAQIGDTLVYTLTYRNSGAITTTGVYINDQVPLNATFIGASGGGTYISAANMISWTLGSVAPAATGSVTFTVKVNNGLANGTIIENYGRIDSNQTDMVNSKTVETSIFAPALSLSKTGPAVAAPGEVITYTLDYANPGDATATGVLISNTIPVSTTYVAGSLQINTGSGWVALSDDANGDAGQYAGLTISVRPGVVSGTLVTGETGQIRFAVTVASGAAQGSSIGNAARLSSDQVAAFNSNLLSTDISPLFISKSSNQTIAAPGQSVVFTAAYGNQGSVTLTNLSLVDAIPAHTQLISGTVTGSGMTIQYSTNHGVTWNNSFTNPTLVTDIRWQRASLPAGQSGSANFQVRLNDPLAANTTIQNVARITSTETSASSWLYSNEVSIGTVDLTLAKIANASFAHAGSPITYTITYGNNGSVPATGAVISDTIPANTTYLPGSIYGPGANASNPARLVWNLGSIPANSGGYQVGFAVTVNPATAPGAPIYNTASLSNTYDSVESNQAQVTVAQDGVTISPNRSNNTRGQGQQVCYGHTIGNTGNLTNTMELTPTHNVWTSAAVSFYKDNDANGVYGPMDTPLTDSNGNSVIDTGQLAAGSQIKILACFTIPTTGVNDGDTDTLVIQAATAAGVPVYTSQVADTTTVRIRNFLNITTPSVNLLTNTTTINYQGTTNPNASVVITNTSTGARYTVTADGFGNFSAVITLTLGGNTLTARSADLNGDVAIDTRAISRTPDPTSGSNDVTISQPISGTITNTHTIPVSGSTDPGSEVVVTVGGNVYTTTADSDGDFTVTVTLPETGDNTIIVTSTDPFGNEDTATAIVIVTPDPTSGSNDITISQPVSGTITNTHTIPVSGSTDPGSEVVVTVGGNVYTTTADSDGDFTVIVTLPETGDNTIIVTSTDPFGNEDTASAIVIVTPDPTSGSNDVTISQPVSGTITNTHTIPVSGSTDPGSEVVVTVGGNVYTTTADSDGDFTVIVTLPETGDNTIIVTSTDPFGNEDTASAIVIVTPDPTSGSNDVTISQPVSGTITNTHTIPVSGSTDPGSEVVVTVGGNVYTTTADSDGDFTVIVTLPETGDNTIIVTSTDPFGNEDTASAIVIVTNDPTSGSNDVTISQPVSGTITNTHTIPVSGSTDPGSEVVVTVGGNVYTTTADSDGDFTVIVTLPETGDNTIIVTSTDPFGNEDTASAIVIVTPDPTSGSNDVTISQPVSGTITNTHTIPVSGSTDPGSEVVVTVGGNVYTTTADSDGDFTVIVTLPETGDNTIIVTSTDPFGNEDTASAIVRVVPDSYTLTTHVVGAGAIWPEPDQPDGYTYGQVVTLTAWTYPGWTFVEWSGDLSGNDTPQTLTMTRNKVVTATFTQDQYTLSVTTVGHGSVEANPAKPTYTLGEEVTLTATADSGWTFTGWSGDLTAPETSKSIIITGNKAVTATFTQNTIPTTTTLGISKSALDVNGAPLLVADTIRYTLRVTNTGSSYTALNVVVTDTLPVSVTLGATSTSQGAASGSSQIVWNVEDILPNGAATMVITVTLNNGTVGQSIINVAVAKADNAPEQSAQICPDNTSPSGGICSSKPQEASPPAGVFLPIIMNNASGVSPSTVGNGQEVPTATPTPNGDTDNDGMPDSWETTHGLNPNVNDADADADGDGLTNLPEYLLHLNPQNPDADGDGIGDGVEIGNPNAPADSDGDGIIDALDADADNDGIPDSQEGAGDADGDGIPNYRDTDADGDGSLDSQEGAGDADGDGIPNYLDTDADGDGIFDVEEGMADPDNDGIPNYLDTDSDGDTSPDSLEGTRDSDGDGIPDYLDPDTTLTHPEPGLSE